LDGDAVRRRNPAASRRQAPGYRRRHGTEADRLERAQGLRRAIEVAGSMRKLGQRIGVSHQAIVAWHDRVPVNWMLKVEKITGIPRHELRPDLFEGYVRK
jgi:hypothetical protein